MKKMQFQSKMSESVALLILDGYQLSFGELTGSYSEAEGYVVLARGNEREIIWLGRDSYYNNEFDCTSIVINRAHIELAKGETLEWNYRFPSKWAEHIVEQHRAFKLGRDWYVDSYEEWKEANEKHLDRYRARDIDYSTEYHTFANTDELMRIVRKVKGFKTVKREDVLVGKRGGSYRIENRASGNYVYLS